MQKIFKYELKEVDDQTIELPSGARILTVQVQRGKPCIWALVDPEAPLSPRYFRIHGTGHAVPDPDKLSYLGTFQVHGGELIFHLFEIIGAQN